MLPLSGVYQPDEGEIQFGGQKMALNNPREARAIGIIVIMRRGQKVGERKAAETSVDEIVSLMVGAEVVHEMGVIPKAIEETNEMGA